MANSFLEDLMAKNQNHEVRRRSTSYKSQSGGGTEKVDQTDLGSAPGVTSKSEIRLRSERSRGSLGDLFTSKFGSLLGDVKEPESRNEALHSDSTDQTDLTEAESTDDVAVEEQNPQMDDWELSPEYFLDDSSNEPLEVDAGTVESTGVDEDEWELNLRDSDSDEDTQPEIVSKGGSEAAHSHGDGLSGLQVDSQDTDELATPDAAAISLVDSNDQLWEDDLSDLTPEELAEARFSEDVDSSTFKFADSLVSPATRETAIEELGRNRTYLKEILSLLNDQALSYYKYGCQRIRPTNCVSKIVKYFCNPDRSLAGIPRTNLIVIYLLFYTVIAEFLQVYDLDPESVYKAVFDSLGNIDNRKGFISEIRSQILGTATEAKLSDAQLRNIGRTLDLLESASEGLL